MRHILTVAGLLISAAASGQVSWPENRGPQQNYHVSDSADYPTTWSVTTGDNVRWRKPLPETGHSGIAISDGKLFLTCFRTLQPSDKSAQGTWVSETVGLCLDADSGDLIWSCDLPGGGQTKSTERSPIRRHRPP